MNLTQVCLWVDSFHYQTHLCSRKPCKTLLPNMFQKSETTLGKSACSSVCLSALMKWQPNRQPGDVTFSSRCLMQWNVNRNTAEQAVSSLWTVDMRSLDAALVHFLIWFLIRWSFRCYLTWSFKSNAFADRRATARTTETLSQHPAKKISPLLALSDHPHSVKTT